VATSMAEYDMQPVAEPKQNAKKFSVEV